MTTRTLPTIARRVLTNFFTHAKDMPFIISCFFSLALLCSSLAVSYFAALYASKHASNFVTDIVLSNIPVFQVDGIFMYGPLVMWIFVTILLFINPERFPFTLKSISLFMVVRAIFISLTHIGPFPGHMIVTDPESMIRFFTSDSDLFFSAHTGLPFLMALVFWQTKWLRYLFMVTSIFFGVIVLLGHVHYTIDVAGAFFITYGIYRLAQLGFPYDWKRFHLIHTEN